MNRTSAELKQLARDALRGRFSLPICAYLIYYIISIPLSSIASVIFPEMTPTSLILNFIAAFIIELFCYVLLVGPSVILLDMSRGSMGRLEDLFYGFMHQPDRILLSHLLIGLISIGCMAPGCIILVLGMELPFLIVLGTLIMISGAVIAVIISLNYSLVIPLYIDCPEKGVMQLMRESKMLMRGNKARLFYLNFSFIGLIILSVFTCFIGLLWIIPYMEMTTLQFYREVIGEI